MLQNASIILLIFSEYTFPPLGSTKLYTLVQAANNYLAMKTLLCDKEVWLSPLMQDEISCSLQTGGNICAAFAIKVRLGNFVDTNHHVINQMARREKLRYIMSPLRTQ